MNGPENRDSGTKPPSPPPPRQDDQWLPPRLREKLDQAEEEGPRSPIGGWIVGILIVAVVVAAGWWFVHNRQVKARAEAAAVAARAAAVADSIAHVRTADSLVAVARADSIAAFQKLPRWKQRQIIARQGGAAAAALVEQGPFALDAGEFLFEDRARTEAEALKASTGLAARVTRAGGAFHVYLGQFDDRDAAARAAANLAAKGLVQEARVVQLP